MDKMDKVSYGAGFALGFFLSIFGVITAICIDKPLTRQGAAAGFITGIFVGVVVYLIALIV